MSYHDFCLRLLLVASLRPGFVSSHKAPLLCNSFPNLLTPASRTSKPLASAYIVLSYCSKTGSFAHQHRIPRLIMATKHDSNGIASARSTQRPDSRASTTSAVSQTDAVELRPEPAAWSPQSAMLMQLQARMEPHQVHYLSHDHQHAMHQHQHNAHFPMQSFVPHDGAYLQEAPYAQHMRVSSIPVQSGPDTHDEKRRKSSGVTATNDKELREMLSRNEGRPLRDVAQEVIQKERTPMAEKTKQLFAMLWLRAVCKPAKTSVPRNRVYSQYADRCATERVVPLNPASFGKLVRVIFPGIQTRRLGVRGESKYHYVDLALEDESTVLQSGVWSSAAQTNGTNAARSRRGTSASANQIDFNSIPRLQADTAAFPVAEPSFDQLPTNPTTPRGPPSLARTFAWPDMRGMSAGSLEAQSYAQTLRFPSRDQPISTEDEPVTLPAIHPYLPARTDPDTAEALCALYRTHCTSLIDSIRFCKEKQFFRLYTSFHGTLTVPVQKLFTHPNLAPWIEQCDLIMYRTMVRFVSRLTLQAAPVVVINIMSNISANLHGHIAKTFSTQPQHVLDAKLRPAAIFGALLHRLIRVNQSAHAAANLLTIDENRERMWFEWVTKVNPKRVMEAELPAECPHEEVYNILTTEMRNLLEPLSLPQDPFTFQQTYNIGENGEFAATYMQSQMQSRPTTANGATCGVSTETILDRWSEFIYSLPARFPKAETRTLLHCISAIGTAALRDITIMAGQSYGHWWVLKIFVDEMALWLAEMGGFLEGSPTSGAIPLGAERGDDSFDSVLLDGSVTGSREQSRISSNPGSRISSTAPPETGPSRPPSNMHANGPTFQSTPGFRPSSLSMTNGFDGSALPLPADLTYHNVNHSQQHKMLGQQEADIDDSGIVMDDDDHSMMKLSSLHGRPAEQASMMT